jgi:hypothetical protein
MVMVTGIIALAVPGSSAFAGEFLILAGVFNTGWGWSVGGRGRDRARGDVHAPPDLGGAAQEPGAAVPEVALDLRPAELGILVPLVACLLRSPPGRLRSATTRSGRLSNAGPAAN